MLLTLRELVGRYPPFGRLPELDLEADMGIEGKDIVAAVAQRQRLQAELDANPICQARRLLMLVQVSLGSFICWRQLRSGSGTATAQRLRLQAELDVKIICQPRSGAVV